MNCTYYRMAGDSAHVRIVYRKSVQGRPCKHLKALNAARQIVKAKARQPIVRNHDELPDNFLSEEIKKLDYSAFTEEPVY